MSKTTIYWNINIGFGILKKVFVSQKIRSHNCKQWKNPLTMKIPKCHTNMLSVNKFSSPVFMWTAGSCSEGSVVTCDDCLQLSANCAWCTEEVISNKCMKPQHADGHIVRFYWKCNAKSFNVLLCFVEFHRLVFSLTKMWHPEYFVGKGMRQSPHLFTRFRSPNSSRSTSREEARCWKPDSNLPTKNVPEAATW